MAEGVNPYGDGLASGRIADALAGRPYAEFDPVSRSAVGQTS
jgi:UDP-N-acetylglucosamine 2-epimerase